MARQAAQVDPLTLKVLQVIVIPDDTPEVQSYCSALIPGDYLWKETYLDNQTKPDGALKNYAGIGHTLDLTNNGFVEPRPKDQVGVSIGLDTSTLKWKRVIDPGKLKGGLKDA